MKIIKGFLYLSTKKQILLFNNIMWFLLFLLKTPEQNTNVHFREGETGRWLK
jgi:hypothetical protein